MLETKVLLVAFNEIVRKAETVEEVQEALNELAHADGIKLRPRAVKKAADKREPQE